jgi:hypothetical protein
MNRDMEQKLIEVLDALETGEPVDAVLARYPEHAADLRVHLITTRALASLRMEPSHAAETRSRQAFLGRAEELRRNAAVVPVRRSWLRRIPVFQMLTVVLLLIGCGVIGLASTRNALPGSPMYGVKLSMEQLQLSMASDAEERFALREQQRQERIREIQTLLARSEEASVTFTGEIRAIGPDQWQIDELTVEITDLTLIEGDPVVGNNATVLGRTEDGRLIASTILIMGKLSIETPEPDETPAPTQTVRPSNTPVPPVVSTPTVPFVPPTSTPTVPIIPTADNDNDNDNGGGDDNDNENENDNDDSGGSNSGSGSGGGGDD